MSLAQGHNTVTPLRLDPATLWSVVSGTLPLSQRAPQKRIVKLRFFLILQSKMIFRVLKTDRRTKGEKDFYSILIVSFD